MKYDMSKCPIYGKCDMTLIAQTRFLENKIAPHILESALFFATL